MLHFSLVRLFAGVVLICVAAQLSAAEPFEIKADDRVVVIAIRGSSVRELLRHWRRGCTSVGRHECSACVTCRLPRTVQMVCRGLVSGNRMRALSA